MFCKIHPRHLIHITFYEGPLLTEKGEYTSKVEDEDSILVENWKGDADGILTFTSLFSAAVSAFLVESCKYLKPNPDEEAVAILAQISRQVASATGNCSYTPEQPNRGPSPAAYIVNTFWLASLVTSIYCAMLATLVRQWARKYLNGARRVSPDRAKAREFFQSGVVKFRMELVVKSLSAFLHISVFFFLAGLVKGLWEINHTIAFTTLGVGIVSMLVYAVFTVLPMVWPDCPYFTP
ncbi:hypothetical protein OF83DRAFT_1060929, partial [Amylostereum chailletii]